MRRAGLRGAALALTAVSDQAAAVTLSRQSTRDLAIVAGLLLADALYHAAYLRGRRATHWLLLEPVVEPAHAGERPAG